MGAAAESEIPEQIARIVALGASNLTRGFQAVVATARSAWGPDIEVVAALGHGRSYGTRSRVLVRSLPGILSSGLWRHLESAPQRPTRGLVTDVGNDILYGFSADQTLAWVKEAVVHLQRFTEDIVLTDLPLAGIRRLSTARFIFFRSLFVPSCRLQFRQVLETAEKVNAGLHELARARNARLFHLNPSWYGFDPIHIRPSRWRQAWSEILGAPSVGKAVGRSRMEAFRLYFLLPERLWLFGLEQVTPQSGIALPSGGRIWLY
jgi:hypothetical protein